MDGALYNLLRLSLRTELGVFFCFLFFWQASIGSIENRIRLRQTDTEIGAVWVLHACRFFFFFLFAKKRRRKKRS